jgi:hypothetical protein
VSKCFLASKIIGANLIASGLVPKTNITFIKQTFNIYYQKKQGIE